MLTSSNSSSQIAKQQVSLYLFSLKSVEPFAYLNNYENYEQIAKGKSSADQLQNLDFS